MLFYHNYHFDFRGKDSVNQENRKMSKFMLCFRTQLIFDFIYVIFSEYQVVLSVIIKKYTIAIVYNDFFTTFASALRNRCRESEIRYVAFC